MNQLAEIRNVSGTAFVVAEFRAVENHQPYPLYRDSVVNLFLNADTRRAAASVATSFPHARDLVRIRTKYLDEMLERQVQSKIRQVVILGAGLDTRAVRKAAPGLTYFEIDDVTTLKLKQTRYEEQGMHINARFIPGNYVTDGFIDLLKTNGFDFSLPTYVIWEGNTMYLPLESNKYIVGQLRRYVKQFCISFDYMADTVISKSTGDAGIVKLVESFASMGAPWVCGFHDIYTFAEEVDLRVVENFKTAELHENYWSGRPLASPIFQFYSICTLGLS